MAGILSPVTESVPAASSAVVATQAAGSATASASTAQALALQMAIDAALVTTGYIDHISKTAGTGAAGTADTYTAWGDIGETVNKGTFLVYNGTDGVDGASGSGSGDMTAATYDPTAKAADAFSMDNMVEGATTKILTSMERAAIATNSAKVSDIDHVAATLPNVDNTSDINKPVSTAQQTALDGKEPANANIQAHVAQAHAPSNAQANRALSSQIEAEAGTDNIKGMTPLRVQQAIAALSGGGGGYTWLVKTAAYTMADNDGVLADTTAGIFTLTLPSTPAFGMKVMISDGANTGSWATNNLTIARNGQTIEGVAADYIADVDNGWIEFVFDGVTWQLRTDFASTGASAGKVLQVVHFDLTAVVSTVSTSFANVGLAASITPSSVSSKILILANANIGVGLGGAYTSAIRLVRNGNALAVGDAAGGRIRAAGSAASDTYTYQISNSAVNQLDSPATTSQVTYNIQLMAPYGSTSPAYLNRNGVDTDGQYTPRTVSSITLMEIS